MQLLDFIVCDDIRHEIGNKMTLVGVYGDQMQIMASPNPAEEKWPRGMKLALFIRLKVLNDEPMPNAFKLMFFQNGKEVNSIDQIMPMPSPPPSTLNIPPQKAKLLNIGLVFGSFKLVSVGEFTFKLNFFKDGKTIYEISPEYALNIAMIPAQDMFQLKN